MTITASASLENDINFTLIQTGDNSQSESASLNYGVSLANGTGSLQINYGVWYTGSLPGTGTKYFDLEAFPKQVLSTTSNINFAKIKSIAICNNSKLYGRDIKILATGTNAFKTPWNGGSGNQLIKPYAVWHYSDPISGMPVSSGNKDFCLKNQHASGVGFTMVVVGVTG